jgi:hypothetical protein
MKFITESPTAGTIPISGLLFNLILLSVMIVSR